MIRSATSIGIAVCASLIATTQLVTTLAFAQGTPLEIKYASSAPPKTVWAMQTERYVDDVNAESKGTMKVNAFIGSQLGSEQDTIQQVARGRIEMGGYSLTAVSLVMPELSILSIPFCSNRPPSRIACSTVRA